MGNESVSYRYAPFGLTLEDTNTHVYNPIRYTARRLDELLGSYDFRSRQYIPSLGKFMQRDPKGYVDGSNLYIYGKNNPLVFRDPFGLNSRPEQASDNNSYTESADGNPQLSDDSIAAPKFGVSVGPFDVRKVPSDTVWHAKNWGITGDPKANFAPAEHALNEFSGKASPYLSASERYPLGAKNIEGARLYIDRRLATAAPGVEYIDNAALRKEVIEYGRTKPQRAAGAQQWLDAQLGEKEGLYKGQIPPEAITTWKGQSFILGLRIYAYGNTARDITQAGLRSIEQGSVKPIGAEAIRQTVSYAGSSAGAWMGVKLGLRCGWGALICSAVGGYLGYKGGDYLGDFIDDNESSSTGSNPAARAALKALQKGLRGTFAGLMID